MKESKNNTLNKKKKYFLENDAPIEGVYLNSETIDLLSIIQCKTIQELKEFVLNCSQFDIQEQDTNNWDENKLEELKRAVFEKYKDTLISTKQSVIDRRSVIESDLLQSGVSRDRINDYVSAYQTLGVDGIKEVLQQESPEQRAKIVQKQHRFIATERDQMKSQTYEQMLELNDNLDNHNTILIASGRYYDVTNKLYDERSPNSKKYDFYFVERGLEFCQKNNKQARYHALLDKQTLDDKLVGKPKEYVLEELQNYVKESIDFINEYNQTHKIVDENGMEKNAIVSVDLFNEIVSFDPPYRNMWQEKYGISPEELAGIFQYANEHKPEGVTYVYNEPFLENPERRKEVIKVLKEMNELSPGLIDTLGSQMHITMTQSKEELEACFRDFKELQDLGIKIQITEFDMCLPESLLFDENGKINQKYSPEFIADFKEKKMKEISEIIKKSGVKLEGITYWSSTDSLDHNVERTNKITWQNGLNRDIVSTRFAGVYSEIEPKREVTMQAAVRNAITQGIGKEEVRAADSNEYIAKNTKEIEGVTQDEQ